VRAIRVTAYGSPLVEERLPEPSGEVTVRIRAAGICHSDGHYRAGRGKTVLPLTPGHEIAGVTDDGERVALHYLLPNGDMLGKEVDGGYAEAVAVPRANLVHIPDDVSFESAAIMMCSTATAYHALRLARLQAGESLAIVGFGGLGFSALQLGRAMGAGEICVAERVREKQALAEKFGAVPELRSADVALEFSGNEALALQALRMLKPGGRLMIVAINLRSMQFDPYEDVLAKERRIIGVADHTHEECVELMELARTGKIDVSPAITRRVPFDAAAINEVLDDLDRGTPHLRSVILP
jgi:2-desacetyl-2-hydroxyethyl bacteriochlorophyllide A dehydrogenase